MKLSVFPESKAHPKSKEEKKSNSFKVSKPYKPLLKEFSTTDELIDIVCNNTWSPFVFKDYRRESDFISTDFIAFDIDSGMRIEESEKVVHQLDIDCLCLPSPSFTEEDHRYRLIFPLARTITNVADYKQTYYDLAKNFPVDPACKDAARFYYGSTLESGYLYESKLLVPIPAEKPKNSEIKRFEHKANVVVGEDIEGLVESLYGEPRTKIPDTIAYFFEHIGTGFPGEMYVRSNSFLFTCGLLGLESDRIEAVFYELYPYDVDSNVRHMVQKVIEEGYEVREEI